MFPDSPGPDSPAFGAKSENVIKPTDEDVVKALFEIEKATATPSPSADSPIHVVPERAWFPRSSPFVWVRIVLAVVGMAMAGIAFLVSRQAVSRTGLSYARPGSAGRVVVRKIDSSVQADAEQVLARVVAGDVAAADELLRRSAEWTGRTHRTPRSEQLVATALNLPDLNIRAAAIQAELALDGVPRDQSGLDQVEQAVGNPDQRVWALWMLGALGNRGVDPVHASKIIGSYLTDPRVDVRAASVDALALVASEETVPMVLDRFRNDPSPVVQERAACDLAQSGMYTHDQRMTAAASLVGWLDDSLISPQQRAWTVQALGDISGQSFGSDSAAWRSWYESSR